MNRTTTDQTNDRSFVAPPPDERVLTQFGLPTDLPGLNALVVGSAVFETEQVLRSDQISRLVIPLYHSARRRYDLKAIAALIHELLIFALTEDVDVSFRTIANTQPSLSIERQERSVENLCLFSGGTDSYSGVLVTQQFLGHLEAVFCAHLDQAKTIHIVDQLQRRVLQRKGIDTIKVRVPSIEARGYAQLRGFLYLLTAASVAHTLNSKRIIVTECGPTMYQPRFSPLDSTTMTTHPFVMRTAAKVAQLLLQRDLEIVIPFENLTKAEVIAISPEKNSLKFTHSCISQRFGTHDGTCYGCVIRRLATIAVGVEDVEYTKNPLCDPEAHSGNLYSLLTFCYEILTRFTRMEEYEKGIIDTYGKRDLFRRFALDNFAAIQRLLLENKRVVSPIREMYESLAQTLGAEIFIDRLAQLKHPRVKPDFGKIAR